MAKALSHPISVEEIDNFVGSGRDRVLHLGERLKPGASVPVTVRKLLRWFGAQRRGSWNNYWIRSSLSMAGLRTEPDFERAYIDGTILIVRADSSPNESTAIPVEEDALTTEVADPIYRLRMLPSANSPPVSISPNTSIREAVPLMLANDYSQLPVVAGSRDVKGIFSWRSYGTVASLGVNVTEVRECLAPVQILSEDASLFAVISEISENECVLVRDSTNAVVGIVTATDVTLLFRQLSEPFLLLSEIENQVRTIISQRGAFSSNMLKQISAEPDRQVEAVSDLTFGEYVRLLENPANWEALDLRVDRRLFVEKLDAVRKIRNEVMHFSPDPLPDEDLDSLRKFTLFLQKLSQALPAVER